MVLRQGTIGKEENIANEIKETGEVEKSSRIMDKNNQKKRNESGKE